MTIELIPVPGIGEIHPGDDLAAIIAAATTGTTVDPTDADTTRTDTLDAEPRAGVPTTNTVTRTADADTPGTSTPDGGAVNRHSPTAETGAKAPDADAGVDASRPATSLRNGDVIVVTQKIVSKAENRLVRLDPDDPSARAALIESESVRVLRRRGDLLIVETKHGFVCANAGIDLSNIDDGWAALLPVDSDRSARRIRDGLRAALGVEVAVIISDTFGRTWRQGVTDIAIGSAGIGPILDLRGTTDERGRELQATEVAVVDEVAGAADLVMGKASGVPVAIVRGVDPTWLRRGDVRTEIVRPPEEDLFR